MTGVLIRRRDGETDTHKDHMKTEKTVIYKLKKVTSGETNPANIWIVDL